MRYSVDVVKQIQSTRTFYVHAENEKEAKIMAIESAKSVNWSLEGKPCYYVLITEEAPKEVSNGR